MNDEKERIRLPSGQNVDLSIPVYDAFYCNFNADQYFRFNNIMNAGQYFPQIAQFVVVMTAILGGHTSFRYVFLCTLLWGAFYTIIWYVLKMYKLPGIAFLSCLLGSYIFRFYLHFIIIAIVSLFVIGDWKVILYCIVSGLITQLIKSFLAATLSSVKYNDEAAVYVSNLRN